MMILCILGSCVDRNPNQLTNDTISRRNVGSNEISNENEKALHKIYVPIYSDIYQKSRNERTQLTATLSIRNTSEKDSLYIKRVDYFNTNGDLVKSYLEESIYLTPLETIDYIIEENDTSGGAGANFILEWYGNKNLSPIFQAVMIGGIGNKSFAFTTEGLEVK
ncbi:DUF3124 domain-containing protein [Zunongwangia sp. HGR-M22]|uniref:DUF3124 domain-containing protein n=1 Tax=Zunongwangia sp. HGR-M22 TaxID=3015168 RepID=UPI0022DDC622|nr:DUF3124 domain-containing protein [Zunongwangia sp. HGR-M22]WBL24237.1 DUF3124 domain-containing protein [Zunongwangia sp. HGR-M22]